MSASYWPAVGGTLLAGAVAARIGLGKPMRSQPNKPAAAASAAAGGSDASRVADLEAANAALIARVAQLEKALGTATLAVAAAAAAPAKGAADELELTEELLYFGSIVTRFDVVKGESFAFDAKAFSETVGTAAEREAARARFKPAAWLGAEYATLCVPAIPATDVVVSAKRAAKAGEWPAAIAKPLVKSKTGKITGVGSGVRSALVKAEDGKWYRLKGCGNHTDGFPFAVVSKSGPLVTIRGSSFEHTTHRELLMSEVVHARLQAHGLSGANRAVGWYQYALPNAQLPVVLRTCVVMQTAGNKRVGDHVLTGLERLLPDLIDAKHFDCALLRAKWPADRLTEANGARPGATWLQTLMESHAYVDFVAHPLPERVPPFPASALPGWRPVWAKAAAFFEQFVTHARGGGGGSVSPGASVGSLLAYVYWRIGREAGAAQRILRDADISWGTYADEMGTHCNAHSNNLVLLPETADPHQPWLSLLDLDMAYTRESFVFDSEAKDANGKDQKQSAAPKRDDAKMDAWLQLEVQGMRMALAGDEQISTGVTATAAGLSDALTDLKWALRDTLLCGFESAFHGKADAHPVVPALHAPAYALMRMALIATTNELA